MCTASRAEESAESALHTRLGMNYGTEQGTLHAAGPSLDSVKPLHTLCLAPSLSTKSASLNPAGQRIEAQTDLLQGALKGSLILAGPQPMSSKVSRDCIRRRGSKRPPLQLRYQGWALHPCSAQPSQLLTGLRLSTSHAPSSSHILFQIVQRVDTHPGQQILKPSLLFKS